MRNFILGLCFGFFVGAAFATYGWSVAQSPTSISPYAPGNFMSDTLLYNSIISNDTDNYLNSLKLQEQSYRSPCPW